MGKKRHVSLTIIERIYSRLLREAAEGTAEGLAASVQRYGGYATAVVYRPAILLSSLKKDPDAEEAYDYSVMAFVQVFRPQSPCAGAWEVKIAAGIGYGKVLYGVAYALSPNGILMSDRKSVSVPAYGAWSGLSGKGYKSYQLDDIRADVTKKLTPNDPSDDCEIHTADDKDCSRHGNRNPDPLNKAYVAQGWENGVLKKMEASHEMFMKVLKNMNIDLESSFKKLKSSGMKLFSAQFPG